MTAPCPRVCRPKLWERGWKCWVTIDAVLAYDKRIAKCCMDFYAG